MKPLKQSFARHKKKVLLGLILALCLLLSTCTPVPASALSGEGHAETLKVVKTTSCRILHLSCPAPTKSYAKKVSQKTKLIQGTERLGKEGNVLGTYSGTETTTVTDSFIKGRSIKTRRTETVVSKTYTNLTFDPAVTQKLLYSIDYRLKRAWEFTGFAIQVDASYGENIAFLSLEGALYVGPYACFDDILFTMGYFASFVCGNLNTSASWREIYQKEAHLIQGSYSGRAPISPAQMYCSSFFNLCRRPSLLRRSAPLSYQYLSHAPEKITQERLAYIRRVLELKKKGRK